MSDLGKISFLKGSLRYKGANDVDVSLQIPLDNTIKELDETDKNLTMGLANLFDKERQECTIFRPTCKLSFLFNNSYSGLTVGLTPSTPYKPFNNQLYYVSTDYYKQLQLLAGNGENNQIQWGGLPQYNEFNLIRNDLNIDGFTIRQPNRPHLYASNSLAPYYNWYIHLTYPFTSTTSQMMQSVLSDGSVYNWNCSDGIPYVISKSFDNGKPNLTFTCPMNHGLSVGESILLSDNCLGIRYFEVYSLGNGLTGSDAKIFTIYDVGYQCELLSEGSRGTFKRVVSPDNTNEGISKYYVRKHKLITRYEDSIITNSGFEKNGLRVVKKFESKQLTPNLNPRVSVKEDSQSYNVSFSKDIDINGLLDNRKRPVTDLYVTIINRGYFGWFNKPATHTNTALKQGWEFNLGPQLNNWWVKTNINSNTRINVSSYNSSASGYGSKVFYYNNNLNVGDLIDGDFCEWNDLTQTERVVSEYYHKITFNPDVFNIGTDPTNPLGYYYKPHNKIPIKIYSNYVEESDGLVINDLPNYAYYKNSTKEFIWRDIYTYGFFDNDGRGLDYPYMNNSHYVHENFQFRIIPEGTNVAAATISNMPLTDGCE